MMMCLLSQTKKLKTLDFWVLFRIGDPESFSVDVAFGKLLYRGRSNSLTYFLLNLGLFNNTSPIKGKCRSVRIL